MSAVLVMALIVAGLLLLICWVFMFTLPIDALHAFHSVVERSSRDEEKGQ